jgi:agmatine/peptidylarginine deiminase
VVCQDTDHRTHVLEQLRGSGTDLDRVQLGIALSDDTWARDHGAITVLEDGQPILLDFVFNGWGGKFPAEQDNQLTTSLAAQGRFGTTPVEAIDLVLEGGSIESDGAGTLLTTRHCLMQPTRNPGLSQAEIEERFRQHFGAERVLWLEHGALEGDDTDGHIDTLARFCDPSTIAYVECSDPEDSQFAGLERMAAEIAALVQVSGEPYRQVPLPLPAPQVDEGRRLPATYANFLIINDAVLVPVYDDPADAIAMERLGAVFPGRNVVGIDCREIIRQGGSLHCLTMQFPLGVLPH